VAREKRQFYFGIDGKIPLYVNDIDPDFQFMNAPVMIDCRGTSLAIRELEQNSVQDLHAIGCLRLAVWREEGGVSEELQRRGVWLDAFDPGARHWIVETTDGELGAAARLTWHDHVFDAPDGDIWRQVGRAVAGPVVNISKLVVRRDFRGCGIASLLNRLRMEAAEIAGARTVTVTASAANANLLQRQGFTDIGLLATFPDRPKVTFYALEKHLGF
jgi:predicted GNAT family N-acyltransferase